MNTKPPADSSPRPQPRRRKPLSVWASFGLTLLAVFLPVAGLLYVSYSQTLAHRDEQLSLLSETTEARTTALFSSTRAELRTLSAEMQGRTVAASVPLMEHATFDSLYVVGFGRSVAVPPVQKSGRTVYGYLTSSNLRVFSPPVPVVHPEQVAVSPQPGQIMILPPTETLQGGARIICNYGMGKDSAGRELIVDALLNPAILVDHDGAKIADGSSVFLIFDNGTQIRSAGQMRADLLPPIGSKTPALTHDRGRRMAITRSSRYPFSVVAAASDPYLLREWRQNALVFSVLGLLMSLALVSLIARQGRDGQSLEAELERALSRDELVVFYQPIINLATGRCAGVEALLRWRHPVRGMIGPGLFVPVAEQSGLILPMTQWLMERVADEIGPLLARHPDLHLGINLSASHFLNGLIAADAARLLSGRIPAERMTFELTESRLLGDEGAGSAEGIRRTMQELRALGYRLALDDFGTGYSNLAYLKRFPFDVLKIDKAFVDGIETDNRSFGLVDAVIAIAAGLGLQIVAEGVEREAQAAYLAGRGVTLAQGYLYARPMPAPDFIAFADAAQTK